MIKTLTKSVFGTTDERTIKKMSKDVKKINSLESEIEKLEDLQLKGKTEEFKMRITNGESLDSVLPEAFAVVREKKKRVLGMRHYDVQLIGGMILHSGKISEMKTGEGKTLMSTLPIYLNALTGKGVHVITVNDYLAKRDRDTMSELYDLRLTTVRSHVQAKWNKPNQSNFGTLYDVALREIVQRRENLMHKDIPIMIQAYFEDMQNILSTLRKNAKNNAELWLVVSTSAYAGIEIPVDMIIGEIGNKVGWYLKDIGVLRYLKKRKSKYSNEINQLRESVVIFTASK